MSVKDIEMETLNRRSVCICKYRNIVIIIKNERI